MSPSDRSFRLAFRGGGTSPLIALAVGSAGGPGVKNCIADVLPILAKMLENVKAEPLHLCHRLDKETTGVMVLARSREVADRIRLLFKTRQVEKIYW